MTHWYQGISPYFWQEMLCFRPYPFVKFRHCDDCRNKRWSPYVKSWFEKSFAEEVLKASRVHVTIIKKTVWATRNIPSMIACCCGAGFVTSQNATPSCSVLSTQHWNHKGKWKTRAAAYCLYVTVMAHHEMKQREISKPRNTTIHCERFDESRASHIFIFMNSCIQHLLKFTITLFGMNRKSPL